MKKIVTSESDRKVVLSTQLVTCAVMCGVATVIILLFHPKPYGASLLAGIGVSYQALLGLAIGGVYWFVSIIGQRFATSFKATQKTMESYRRLDLSGWNPLWFSLAAGFGEELLFRGALQPIIGIWLTSVLFVVAHIRAYQFKSLDKTVAIQVLGIFTVSVAFGFIGLYAGLVSAMIVHVLLDVVGLYTIRRASFARQSATRIVANR